MSNRLVSIEIERSRLPSTLTPPFPTSLLVLSQQKGPLQSFGLDLSLYCVCPPLLSTCLGSFGLVVVELQAFDRHSFWPGNSSSVGQTDPPPPWWWLGPIVFRPCCAVKHAPLMVAQPRNENPNVGKSQIFNHLRRFPTQKIASFQRVRAMLLVPPKINDQVQDLFGHFGKCCC